MNKDLIYKNYIINNKHNQNNLTIINNNKINPNDDYIKNHYSKLIDKYLPDYDSSIPISKNQNYIRIDKITKPETPSRLTKEEIRNMINNNKFLHMDRKIDDFTKKSIEVINSNLTNPVNQLIHYHNIREEEMYDRREIEYRREKTKKELEKAKEMLNRELIFDDSDENEDDDINEDKNNPKTFQSKADKVEKRIEKYLKHKEKEEKTSEKRRVFHKKKLNISSINTINEDLIYKKQYIRKAELEMKYLKPDLEIEVNRNMVEDKRKMEYINKDLKQLYLDVSKRLDAYEYKTLQSIEYLRDIFENCGSNRLKYLSKRILSNEDVEEEPIVIPKRNEYDVNKDTDLELLRLIEMKKKVNPDYYDEINRKYDRNEIVDIEEWKKERKNKLKDMIENQIKTHIEKVGDVIKRKEGYKNVSLDGWNKFRVYVNVVMSMGRLLNLTFEKELRMRIEQMNTFSSYYETVNISIEKWVFGSIKIIYYNIIENINEDVSLRRIEKIHINNKNMIGNKESKVSSKSIKSNTIYIKLETIVKGMIESLVLNSRKDMIETNILKFLSIITSKGSYVPVEFFTLFELSRIDYKEGIVMSMNESSKQMIILIYIIYKILLRICLIQHKYGSKIEKDMVGYENFKSIISIFYWGLMKFLKNEVVVMKEVINKQSLNNHSSESESNDIKRRYLYKITSVEDIIDKKYKSKVKVYLEKQLAFNFYLERRIKNNIKNKIDEVIPDIDPYDISYFNEYVFSQDETERFFERAEARNFYIEKVMVMFVEKLCSMIPDSES